MDEITDNVGGLSLQAKEWKPGQGFAPTPKNNNILSSSSSAFTSTSRQVSAGSGGSGGGGSTNNVSGLVGQSSWGDAQHSQTASAAGVDVNGTHFFGSGGRGTSSSWEGDQSSSNDNVITPNINTTIPSQHNSSRHHANPNNPNNPHHPQQQQQQQQQHRATTLNSALTLPSEEYHHYRDLSLACAREMEPNDARHKAVPPSFCRAYCLDNDGHHHDASSMTQQRSSFGYPTSVFRVTSITDGNVYCLRRLDSVRCVSHKIAQTVMYQWLSNASGRLKFGTSGGGGFDHPGIVRWYKCFLSQRAVFFVHQYHAGAVTLRERFFSNNRQQQQQGGGGGIGGNVPLPESLIWSCLVQLVSAIRSVHENNLAVRTLQLNHILCTQENITSSSSTSSSSMGGSYGLPKLRLRINCIGIVDILEFEARKGLEELQIADMRSLGCILLSMCTGTEITVNDIYNRNNTVQQQQQQGQMLMEYFQFVQQNYSRELYMLIHSLVNPSAPPSNIRSIAASMAMRAFDELDIAHGCIDEMHTALLGIYESGRALKLLLKLAFVNERPEFGIDKNWSESGDCYILKLFRDFVFHQADGSGRPVMDLGHVVSSLNKLDAADEEKIVLTSRDGKNVLVVSFADVAWCLEKSYQELCSNSVPITPSNIPSMI